MFEIFNIKDTVTSSFLKFNYRDSGPNDPAYWGNEGQWRSSFRADREDYKVKLEDIRDHDRAIHSAAGKRHMRAFKRSRNVKSGGFINTSKRAYTEQERLALFGA